MLDMPAVGRADARDRLRDRLDRDRHVMGVGMNRESNCRARSRRGLSRTVGRRVCRLERSAAGSIAEPNACSCMSLSRQQGNAASGQRQLHQCGTIESETGLAAPEVGSADKTFGDADEIAFLMVRRRQDAEAAQSHWSRLRRTSVSIRAIAKLAAKRKRFDRRQLDRGGRKHEGAQRRATRVGAASRRRRPERRSVASRHDRRIASWPHDQPSSVVVVDRDALALERLGVEQRVVPWLFGAAAPAAPRPCAVCPRRSAPPATLPSQMFGGKIRPRRRDARVVVIGTPISHNASPATRRARAPPGTRRPPAVPVASPGSRRRCRNAARPSPRW